MSSGAWAPGDEGALLAWNARDRGPTPTPDATRALLARDGAWLVAALVGEIVGLAVAYVLPRVDGRTMVCLYSLDVDDAHRRRGIGRALVEEVVGRTRGISACKLWVLADEENVAAHRTYLAAGGTLVGHDRVYTWTFPIQEAP